MRYTDPMYNSAFFGPQKFSPYQIGGYPHCWIMGATDLPMDGNDETSQATLHASDPRAMRHKDKADAIQKRILELNPDARVSQWTYARQTSRAFQGGDFGYGKAVVSPNLFSKLVVPHPFLFLMGWLVSELSKTTKNGRIHGSYALQIQNSPIPSLYDLGMLPLG